MSIQLVIAEKPSKSAFVIFVIVLYWIIILIMQNNQDCAFSIFFFRF